MKTIPNLFAALLLCAFAFPPLGCGTTAAVHTDGTSIGGSVTNGNVGVDGSWNAQTGEWNVGITITFKSAPDAETLAALDQAGVVAQRGGKVFQLNGYDRTNVFHSAALEAALKAGATLTKARN